MTAYRSFGICLAILIVACSSSEEGDLFAGDSTSTGSVTATSGGNTGSTTTGSSNSTSDTTTNAGPAVMSAVSTSTSSTSTTGAGGMTSTVTSATTETASTSGSTSTATATATTGSVEPVTVVLEYESDEDCVELQCPSEAPHLVACEITFSSADDEYFCVAVEAEGVVFVKSGDSCDGSVINAGSTITCSSEALGGEITAEECVTDKETMDVVTDRCDCETPTAIEGCTEG